MSSDRIAVVIEDDADVREVIETILIEAGFVVKLASTGAAGVDLVRTFTPALTTLDVNMPGMDGFETLKRIRVLTAHSSIIMISARFDEVDVVRGLSAGADDFVAKPFRTGELRARIDAVLRRADAAAPAVRQEMIAHTTIEDKVAHTIDHGPDHDISEHAIVPGGAPYAGSTNLEPHGWLHHNGLRLHPARRDVEVDGASVLLTRSEFDLLAQLLQPVDQVHSKAELILELRSDSYATALVTHADKRALEVHVANLRRKIGPAARIETVHGIGYRLEARARK